MGTHTSVRTRIQGTHVDHLTSLYISDCPSCGVIFGIPTEMEKRRRDDGKQFYCPNGHTMSWHDTLEKRLEADLKRERETAEWLREERDAARHLAETERRRAAAAKGNLTKLRRRVANGCCPEPGCKRSFTNIRDHIATCHPEHAHLVELDEQGETTTP